MASETAIGIVDRDLIDRMNAEVSAGRLASIPDGYNAAINQQTIQVYKDECVYSFDSPFSDSGLYVNLLTLQGVGADFLELDSSKTGCRLYLHEKWEQIPIEKAPVISEESEEGKGGGDPAPTKLAIGVEGGFVLEPQFEIRKSESLVYVSSLPSASEGFVLSQAIPISGPDSLPDLSSSLNRRLVELCRLVIDSEGMRGKVSSDTWEGEDSREVSKYAEHLIQEDNGKKISNDPSSWRCEMSGDTNNLWLNLSTGYIGGGRKNWDGTGGSGAALLHFENTGGIYPLCAKLGTITKNGADVWSYAPDEDTLVLDPYLDKHLAHWGIDIMKLEKTDKTLQEMEVQLNMQYDWARIMEGGKDLAPLTGVGYQGIKNIGSSCYMNSVLQPLLAIPEVQQRYFVNADSIVSSAPARDTYSDFTTQFSKVAVALLSPRYTAPAPANEKDFTPSLQKYVIAPYMFKQLVGKGHREFSSGRQQDASEYLQHLLTVIQRAERTNLGRIAPSGASGPSTTSIFDLYLQQRIVCSVTGQVKVLGSLGGGSAAVDLHNILELRIPLDRAINKKSVEEQQERKRAKVEGSSEEKSSEPQEEEKLQVPFEACLQTFFGEEAIDYLNPMLGQRVPCAKTQSILSFPRYLVVKLARYTIDSSWRPVKIDARVDMPEEIDLSEYRAQGLLPGETPMPSSDDNSQASSASASTGGAPEVADEAILAQLLSMGFSENGCRRACLATNNSSVDVAMGWIFEHMEDPDFNDPPAAAAAPNLSSGDSFPPEQVAMLSEFGFTEAQAKKALRETGGDMDRAAEWLFSHPDDDGLDAPAMLSTGSAVGPVSGDTVDLKAEGAAASGRYDLMSIISHLGGNTGSGHYVCHIKKDGQWAFFNDEKVARSESPPLDCGFMYIYRRRDGAGTL